ncbi:MAG: ribose-phosphate pyrophosphokinase [Deltaproteobacteria bacterium]|nr:MAG: ribose-phosphate pyrophosphokinase [Deltaproteobacteria bacterium]
MTRTVKIFTGNANARMAQAICDYLDVELGQAEVKHFSDGETSVELGENVRGMDVFVIQSTCAPANTNIMELLILLDTLRRASAKRITAVIPYYGYGRQDRKVKPRSPITAKLMADLITTAGASRVLCLDLHAGQIQGFFNIPVDNLFAMPVLLDEVRKLIPVGEPVTVISPDAGGVERARAFAKRLNAELAIADKRREKPNVAEVMRIVGDVKDRTAVIVDDIVDTAGSLTKTARAVMEGGATRVMAAISHPVLSGQAVKEIEESLLDKVVITDTIPLRPEAETSERFAVTTVSPLLGEAIRRIHNEESVSSLFV